MIVWIKIERDCDMPGYNELALWYREDGFIFSEMLDKDGNDWLYGSKEFGEITHWARINYPQ